jgi:SAM-dependent methyltransferase
MLAPGAEVVGVEREPRWVREAARDGDAGAVRVSYREGAADALPFDDASVDLVTCQTLLIHIGAPERVLAEMRRILKPGGTLLAAEPNNIGGSLAQLACVAGTDVDDLTASVRLEIVCERGKEALGLGFNSLGETLVGLLSPSHWRDTRVWNCDRAYAARAPYPDDALAMLAQERRWHDEGALLWPEDETRRYFLAGGGRDDDFPPLWEAVRRVQAQRFRALDDGSYAGACGGLFYLVAATAS